MGCHSNRSCRRSSLSVVMTLMATFFFTMMLAPPSAVLAIEKTWTLHHSLNGGQDFARRGSVVLTVDPETDAVDIAITNDNSTLNKESYLAAKAPGAMYQLKLVEGSKKGAADSKDAFVLSSVPGCHLLRANFREEIVLTLGPKASVISLAYIPLVSPLAPKSCDDEMWDTKLANNHLPEGWESRISWETATPGMVLLPVMPSYRPPPGLRWLPRMANNGKLYQAQGPPGTGEKGGGEGGDGVPTPPVDNTPLGFLKRYWYILLPLFIMNFMGGTEPPPADGQPGQGGAPAVGAAPTAAPAGGAGPKQRRGKRG